VFKNNPFHRGGRRVPYVADKTTWTCNTCKQQAWVTMDGTDRGCGCGNAPGPRPLIADDPNHWSNLTLFDQGEYDLGGHELADDLRDPRDELIETLQEQLNLATEIALRQSATVTAARHLMRVLASHSATAPIFKLNDEHDDASIELIRHAVLDLQSTLEGTPTPALCLPERTH
jgi:hypothetical protein